MIFFLLQGAVAQQGIKQKLSFLPRISYGVNSGRKPSLSSQSHIKCGINSGWDPWIPAFAGMTMYRFLFSPYTGGQTGMIEYRFLL
jgi:hypothetical protein